MTRRLKVLVASPAFHGYLYAVSGALSRMGYEVISYAYDNTPLFGRVVSRVPAGVRRRWAGPRNGLGTMREAERQAAEVVEQTRPDAAVVIRGEELGPRFREAPDMQAIPRIVWLYDASTGCRGPWRK